MQDCVHTVLFYLHCSIIRVYYAMQNDRDGMRIAIMVVIKKQNSKNNVQASLATINNNRNRKCIFSETPFVIAWSNKSAQYRIFISFAAFGETTAIRH